MKSSNIGGQAVLEGIMMRHGDDYAVAVRKPDGEIFVQKEEYHSVIKWKALTKIPFIRGVFNFIDSMVLGIKTLMFSAEFYEDEEEVKSEKELTEEEIAKKEKQEKWMMNATVAISVVIAAAVFMVLPYFLSSLLKPLMPSYHLRTLVEGFVRIGIFILYIALISRMDDIQRTLCTMARSTNASIALSMDFRLPLIMSESVPDSISAVEQASYSSYWQSVLFC